MRNDGRRAMGRSFRERTSASLGALGPFMVRRTRPAVKPATRDAAVGGDQPPLNGRVHRSDSSRAFLPGNTLSHLSLHVEDPIMERPETRYAWNGDVAPRVP